MTTTMEAFDMAKGKAARRDSADTRELVRFGVYLWRDQLESLQAIHSREGVNVAHMIRAGIDRELNARGVKGAHHGR